jgi:hypothetical protein
MYSISFGLTLQGYWLASEWLAKMGGVRPSPRKRLQNCPLILLFIPPLAAAKVESVDPSFDDYETSEVFKCSLLG